MRGATQGHAMPSFPDEVFLGWVEVLGGGSQAPKTDTALSCTFKMLMDTSPCIRKKKSTYMVRT